jgi:hypothetical protein
LDFYSAISLKQQFPDKHAYNILTRIEGIMVSAIASSAVDTGFKIRSGQKKRLKKWYLLLLRESRSIKEEGRE